MSWINLERLDNGWVVYCWDEKLGTIRRVEHREIPGHTSFQYVLTDGGRRFAIDVCELPPGE